MDETQAKSFRPVEFTKRKLRNVRDADKTSDMLTFRQRSRKSFIIKSYELYN